MQKAAGIVLINILLSFLLCSSTHATTSSAFRSVKSKNTDIAEKVIRAKRVENSIVRVDGRLDESIWQSAPVSSDFIQSEPEEGVAASERTTVRIVYDNEALYVAVCAYDSEPDKIKGLLTRRDEQSPSDWLTIAFDSYGDHRTAFQFGVNPVGVKTDAYFSDDVNKDVNWDAVWDVAVLTDDEGWKAEFCIPFTQLRFPKAADHIWGFQATRLITRKGEVQFWQHKSRDDAGWVSRFGELRGLENIPPARKIQLLPYTVGSASAYPEEEGNPFKDGRDWDGAFGGDIKYGITSNITLDMTLNPDFGQVEADPSVFNLTAYESFFEEKRPFFIEGNNIFHYRIGIGDGNLGQETLFYTRRIGRSPQHELDLPDGAYSTQPRTTTINGAAKITGKTKSGWTLGLLEALTAEEHAEIELNGERYRQVVEPRTNYFVFRSQKDFREGRTTIGGIFTNVYRDIPDESLNYLTKNALAGGVDFSHRWRDDTYFVSVNMVASHIRGHENAIREAQLSSSRYFQRPDAAYLSYDPGRTSLSGFSSTYQIGKIGGGHWRFGAVGTMRSPGFEVNDIGYVQSVDMIVNALYMNYIEFTPGQLFRDYFISASGWNAHNFGGEHVGDGYSLHAHFRFLNYWTTTIGGNAQINNLSQSMLRGGPGILLPDLYDANFNLQSDDRKPLIVNLSARVTGHREGTFSYNIMPSITLRPTGRFNLSLSFGYIPSVDNEQYVDKVYDNEGEHYIFARLDQKTVFLVTRLNYTLTPNLGVQFYAMPFITSGSYDNFKEVIAPKAARYEDRFSGYEYRDNPDFNFQEFRSNLVVRWEYLPGSTIFFVWSQGRTQFYEHGAFSWRSDTRSLFDTEPENIFMVKINRWFNL